jgi:hypothetical protein
LLNHSELYAILSDPIQFGSSNAADFNDFVDSESDSSSGVDWNKNITLFLFVEGNYTGISTVEGVEFRPVKYNIGKSEAETAFANSSKSS